MKSLSILILSMLCCHTLLSQCPILPSPNLYVQSTENLVLEKTITLNEQNLPSNIKVYLQQELQTRFGIKLKVKSGKAMITFSQMKQAFGVLGAYQIEIKDHIEIQSSDEAGCFYAVVSFLQLIQGKENEWKIQQALVKDQPKHSWRGLHLDVSRHFFTVDEVKRYIDLMALYKYNTFHWHLTDDQGWRIEIKKYPKLTEIGAWRDSTVDQHYTTIPRTYTKQRYGGFYTQDQIREVITYAQERYITVVPEIEMPGHSRAALAAYPEYSCTGIQQAVPGLWGVFEDIYCSKTESIQFLQDILLEVIALFPSTYIHIGGDEAPKDRWKACSKCQQVIQENQLKDEHELQSYFIKKMDAFLTAKGKRLIGWDEILEGGLSPNASVMSWRGIEGGIEAANQSHDVVMSPGSHCYFDHYQSDNRSEPLAIGGFTPIEKVYQYEPIPTSLDKSKQHHILGAQANLWTEYIPDMKQLEYMTYPRAIALAEVLWSEEKIEYEVFWDLLVKYQLSMLAQKKVNFSKSLFNTKLEIKPNEKGIELVFISPHPDSQPSIQILEREIGVEPRIRKSTIRTEGVAYEIPICEFEILKHSALGLPIIFHTPPHANYANNAALKLVDGIVGRRPWNGKEWLGFDTSKISFTVDLLQESQIKTIELSMLQDPSSWIYLPQNIKLFTSIDGEKWESQTQSEIIEKTKITLSNKARYLRFEIESMKEIPKGQAGEGHKPWTFFDEILIDYHL